MRLVILLLVALLGKGVLTYFETDVAAQRPETVTMEHGSGDPPPCCKP